MSLLDTIEIEEVTDDDKNDSRPKRGQGLDISLNKCPNSEDEDIVLSCVARIPKKIYVHIGESGDTCEIYTPVPKFIVSNYFDPNRPIQRVFHLYNEIKKRDFKLKLCYTDENLLFDNVFKGSDKLFCDLQISNETSEVGIDKSVWNFIDDILAEGDFHYTHFGPYRSTLDISDYLLSNRDITTWLSFLKSNIPVRLVDEKQMPNPEVPVEFPYKKTLQNETEKDEELLKKRKINGDNRYMEALGVYRSYEENGEDKRDILLCPKRIKETADKLKIPFNYLVTIVYLHELGHAALDETIDLNEEENIDEIIKINIKDQEKIDTNEDKFRFVMEESLANMIMLQYINWYTECCYEKLKDGDVLSETAELIVKKQSPAYAFGLYQFNADVDWLSWRNYKANISDKQISEISDKQISEWYDLFGNIMNPDIYKQSFNKLFL